MLHVELTKAAKTDKLLSQQFSPYSSAHDDRLRSFVDKVCRELRIKIWVRALRYTSSLLRGEDQIRLSRAVHTN